MMVQKRLRSILKSNCQHELTVQLEYAEKNAVFQKVIIKNNYRKFCSTKITICSPLYQLFFAPFFTISSCYSLL